MTEIKPIWGTSKTHGVKPGVPTLIVWYRGDRKAPQGTGELRVALSTPHGIEFYDVETGKNDGWCGSATRYWAAAPAPAKTELDAEDYALIKDVLAKQAKTPDTYVGVTWTTIERDGRVSAEEIHEAATAAEGDNVTTAEWARRAVAYVVDKAHEAALKLDVALTAETMQALAKRHAPKNGAASWTSGARQIKAAAQRAGLVIREWSQPPASEFNYGGSSATLLFWAHDAAGNEVVRVYEDRTRSNVKRVTLAYLQNPGWNHLARYKVKSVLVALERMSREAFQLGRGKENL